MNAGRNPKRVKAVIFDWAGTLIDFGSLTPVTALQELFVEYGVTLTMAEVRAPMGLLKRDHIRALFAMERVVAAWQTAHGALPDEQTVEMLNGTLERRLPEIAARNVLPLPGAVEALQRLRAREIRIGSTTGYTRETMQAIQPVAQEAGIIVDSLCTPSEVPAGRPYPWMIFRNCMDLDVYPPAAIVKVGDTLQDIYEGLNAGVWTVGVIVGSSLLGLSEAEYARLDRASRAKHLEEARLAFMHAGAHYTIDSLDELDVALNRFEQGMKDFHGLAALG